MLRRLLLANLQANSARLTIIKIVYFLKQVGGTYNFTKE
jgi:hypothetical protein